MPAATALFSPVLASHGGGMPLEAIIPLAIAAVALVVFLGTRRQRKKKRKRRR